MSDIKLGQLIKEKNPKRDAIHVAVAPVKAAEKLAPGQSVNFVDDGPGVEASKEGIGIVDPFLGGLVFPEQWFWVLIYPGTIKNLRHDWDHPSFGKHVNEGSNDPYIESNDPYRFEGSEDKLTIAYAANECGLSYQQMMDVANDYVANRDPLVAANEGFRDVDWVSFWEAWQRIMNEQTDVKECPFRGCAC